MKPIGFTVVLMASCAALPGTAAAQIIPDIQDAINQGTGIDAALEEQRRATLQRSAEDGGAIDGEAGVYVLTINEIFYVGASAGGGWAENPVRTVDDLGGSVFGSAAASAGVQTRLGETFDGGIALSVSGVEYDKSFAPSSRTVTASTNLGLPIADTPLYASASAFGGWNYDGDFKNGTGFYGASLALSAGVPLGPKTVLRGSVNAGRQEGEIEENNAWNANLSFDLTHYLTQSVAVGIGAGGGRVWFDDFYEDVTFVERLDWQYGGNVNASWAPTNWLSVSASVGYDKRDSAFFLSNYDGFEASLAVAARKRF